MVHDHPEGGGEGVMGLWWWNEGGVGDGVVVVEGDEGGG